jgi:hypothetical protein
VSSMQRTKGKLGEREVVNMALDFGLPAKRTWQTAQGENPECDIVINGAPYQVKRRRSFKFLYDALGGVNGVFLRGDAQDWLVVIPARDYLELLKGQK